MALYLAINPCVSFTPSFPDFFKYKKIISLTELAVDSQYNLRHSKDFQFRMFSLGTFLNNSWIKVRN